MRPNEEFVLNALVGKFGGIYSDGEDPPDAYISFGNERVAVEVTALVQQLENNDGSKRPRLSDDAPAANLANDLDRELINHIPHGKYFFLILPAPINNVRKTKAELSKTILDMVKNNSTSNEIEVFQNRISINVYDRPGKRHKKVAAAITNRYSSANILENAHQILKDRIETKNNKISITKNTNEYWLALFNDYWIADMETYKNAYQSMKGSHRFSRIYIVNGGAEVFQLC